MIGVGGLCSVYDPPVSYWCSEHTSGGGAFPFRTPSGVIYKPPNGPYEHGDFVEVVVVGACCGCWDMAVIVTTRILDRTWPEMDVNLVWLYNLLQSTYSLNPALRERCYQGSLLKS